MGGKVAHTRVAHRCLLGEQNAVLRLAAGPSQEQDELTSDRCGNLVAQVLFDECESQINASTDSCRSVKLSIFDKDWVSLDEGPRESALEGQGLKRSNDRMRLRRRRPLAAYDRDTFYTFDAKGYTDYPFYNGAAAAA